MICFLFKPARIKDGKRHQSPYYSGKLRLETWTKERVFALHTTDKRIAEIKLRELAVQFEKESMGLLPPRSVTDGLKRPLKELLDDFLADLKAKGRMPETIRKYGGTLRILFDRLAWKELRDVTLRSFTQWRKVSNLSAKSLNDMLANCGTFFRWLEYQRIMQENPLRYIQRIDTRGSKQCRRALSADEVTRLLASVPAIRCLVYLTAVNTGLRRKELNGLRWGDFQLAGNLPAVCVPASLSKNRKEALIPLRPELVDALLAFRPADCAPFNYVLRGHVPRISTLRKDLQAAQIPLLDQAGRRIDLHSLRVTFGTLLLASGVHARVVQELMRHSDIKLTTKLYTDASQLPLAAGLALLPSFTLRNPNTQKHTQEHTQTGVLGVPVVTSHVTPGQSGKTLQSA